MAPPPSSSSPRSSRPPLLPLLLLLLLLTGSAALPALPRAQRHSDGTFTSELSRLRDSASLQRLLQGLVGKRSDQEAENGTAWPQPAEGQLCLRWSYEPALRAWPPWTRPGLPGSLLAPGLGPRLWSGLKQGGSPAEEGSRRPRSWGAAMERGRGSAVLDTFK